MLWELRPEVEKWVFLKQLLVGREAELQTIPALWKYYNVCSVTTRVVTIY